MKPYPHKRRGTPVSVLLLAALLAGMTPTTVWSSITTEHQWSKPSTELHAVLGRAESLAEKEHYAEAEKVLRSYADSHPADNHPLLSYELGYFSFRQGALQQSIADLQKTTVTAPAYSDGWLMLARAWQEIGNRYPKEDAAKKQERTTAMRNAAEAMTRCAGLLKEPDLLYQTARLWLEGESPSQALEIFEQLVKDDNPKQEWFMGLSDALKALKRHEETAEVMEKAARVQNNPQLFFHAAWLWYELDKPKRALPLLIPLAEGKKPDKNWLLLLVSVFNTLQQSGDAARTMEKLIALDPIPDHLYNGGLLWMQDEKPDRALPHLLRLVEETPQKAEWFVALAQAWLSKEELAEAADAMERAAQLSGDPDHRYRAGILRLQLKQADRAIDLLTPLADLQQPKSDWMVALANSWLLKEDYHNGAVYMEKAAHISGKGELFHRASMLWRMDGAFDRTVALLKQSVACKKVEQLWLIDLASVLLDLNRDSEVAPVMAKTSLEEKRVASELRYRGAGIWLALQEPVKAYPLLESLCSEKVPRYSWLNSFVTTCVELGHMQKAEAALDSILSLYPDKVGSWKLATWLALQQSDYKKAAAAKEVVRRFEPQEHNHLEELSRLYLLAGVPNEAAEAYRQILRKKSSPEALHHLVDIYLSGQLYQQALESVQALMQIERIRENYETLGDIYYALHRYAESAGAYEQAADIGNSPDIMMKAAYAAMKAGELDKAAGNFEKAMELSSDSSDGDLAASAMKNLAYVNRLKKERFAMQQD